MGFETGGDREAGALVMCTIPLDLERRFEQRWAARFSGALQEHRLEGQCQQLTESGKRKRKARRVVDTSERNMPGERTS
jgi:hypothetical protein